MSDIDGSNASSDIEPTEVTGRRGQMSPKQLSKIFREYKLDNEVMESFRKMIRPGIILTRIPEWIERFYFSGYLHCSTKTNRHISEADLFASIATDIMRSWFSSLYRVLQTQGHVADRRM